MKKFSVLVLLAFVALCVFADGSSVQRIRKSAKGVDPKMHWEYLEVGLQVGVGFHEGMAVPAEGVHRVYQNALECFADKFPIMETYGAVVRYSIDYHWALQLQGMRQRLYFTEEGKGHFYNSMWDVDVTAEYNILPYGLRVHRPKGVMGARIRPCQVTPYVLFGLGVSMSNKNAIYRGAKLPVKDWTSEDLKEMYPAIKPAGGNLAASAYVPVGVGVKWRVDDNWQLKMACQYNLGIGKDPSGGTRSRQEMAATTYDNMKVGVWHNVVLNIGVVYNFGSKPKRMLLM